MHLNEHKQFECVYSHSYMYVGAQHAVEGVDSSPRLPWFLPPLSRGPESHYDCLQHGLQGALPSGVCAPGVDQPSWTGERL